MATEAKGAPKCTTTLCRTRRAPMPGAVAVEAEEETRRAYGLPLMRSGSPNLHAWVPMAAEEAHTLPV